MNKQVAKKYSFAVIASDIVILTVKQGELQVLLIKMKSKPYISHWAAPGGLVQPSESVDDSAKRVLKEKSGISNVYLEQLYTFGDVNRDPFGRVVSVAYFALIPYKGIALATTEEYSDIQWFPLRTLPKLAYDHKKIITTAINRLRAKLEHTNIVYSLLPKEFTLSELQNIYEIILEKKLDKRNFRKKILSLNLLKKTNKKTSGSAHRPAELYTFTSHKPQVVKML